MAKWFGLASLFGGRKSELASSRELQAFIDVYGSRLSKAGVTVTWQTALTVSTMMAICRVLMDGVAQVPFKLFVEADGSRAPAKDHPLYDLVALQPNSWQTSFDFRETLMLHLVLTNNAFVFVNKVGSQRKIREMIPIEPNRVQVKQLDNYQLEYHVTGKSGQAQVFGQDAIWHLRGPSWNGWSGLDAVKLARDAIGLSMAIEQGQASFQKSGGQQPGVFSTKEVLTPERFTFLSTWLDRHLPGGDRFGKPLVLDDSAEYASTTMTGVDQQLLETRRHQVEEMCRPFRVMPLMVGHPADMAARAATESIIQMHVTHTLMPWYVRIEQSATMNLLTPEDREAGYYLKFVPNALMRGSSKDRAEYYSKALGSGGTKGWMTQNDVRDLEELDRSNDPEADKLPQPTAQTQAPKPTPADDRAADDPENDK